jgi:hypothetical protein
MSENRELLEALRSGLLPTRIPATAEYDGEYSASGFKLTVLREEKHIGERVRPKKYGYRIAGFAELEITSEWGFPSHAEATARGFETARALDKESAEAGL